jgi:biopolymer transport protein TolQ
MEVGLWHIISTTDFITKCVLVFLLGMSVVCWALAFYKYMLFKVKMAHIKQAQTLLINVKSLEDFLARAASIQNTFAGEVIAHFLTDFKTMLKLYETHRTPLDDKDWYLLQANINQRLDDVLQQEEALLPLLSTSAQVAPLVGLFGTVWGLIHAFMGIAQQRSADISAVAPGIAEALITTLGGLVVAIPALVLYHYLQGRMRVLEQGVTALADKCMWIMRAVTYEAPAPFSHSAFASKTVQKETL